MTIESKAEAEAGPVASLPSLSLTCAR